MIFEVGKCYRHTTGHEISIVAEVETTMFGKTLLAEQTDRLDFMAVGLSEANSENYKEITREEWMRNFTVTPEEITDVNSDVVRNALENIQSKVYEASGIPSGALIGLRFK